MFNKCVDAFSVFLLVHVVAIFIFNLPAVWGIDKSQDDLLVISMLHVLFWGYATVRRLDPVFDSGK